MLGLALEEFSLNLKKVAPADLDAVVKELNLKDADELFLVVKGHLIIHFTDRDVHAEAGEFVVVPRGVEHKLFCSFGRLVATQARY